MATRPNLSDIANALGVSIATVSNAMSGKGRVSGDMISQVRMKAAELGYIPSLAGRALRTGRSGVIGLVLADIAHPVFPQIAQAVENAADDVGYGVLIADSRGDIGAQTRAIERLIERGADGLVVVPRYATRIGDIGRPVAVIDAPSTPGNTVSADHWGGGRLMAAHLRELGHRRFVLIGGHSGSNVQNDRIGGLKSGLGDAVSMQTIWVDDLEARHGHGCDLGLAEKARQGTTAFAAVSDLYALRALTELQRAGIPVPGRASVTGFDNLPSASAVAPTLTTMKADMAGIARIAMACLIAQIDNPHPDDNFPDRSHPGVPMQPVIRQSSGPAMSEEAAPDVLFPIQTINQSRRKA